jgi:hypothetical protein
MSDAPLVRLDQPIEYFLQSTTPCPVAPDQPQTFPALQLKAAIPDRPELLRPQLIDPAPVPALPAQVLHPVPQGFLQILAKHLQHPLDFHEGFGGCGIGRVMGHVFFG